jgi:hypothetical protein
MRFVDYGYSKAKIWRGKAFDRAKIRINKAKSGNCGATVNNCVNAGRGLKNEALYNILEAKKRANEAGAYE